MAESSPWNSSNADAMTVDSWGGGTQLSAFPPLVPVNSNGGSSGLFQCPTHPQHRTTDPSSFCPLCESAWEDQRRELRAKRQNVEEQLQNLQSVDSAAAILQDLQVSMKEWKPQPEEETPPPQQQQRNDFFNRTHPGHNNNNNNNISNNQNSNANNSSNNNNPGNNNIASRGYQTYQPNSRQQQEPPPPPPPMPNGGPGGGMPPPSFFSPFYDQSAGPGGAGGPPGAGSHPQMQAFAMQLHSMQRMQDWMLWQKEQECQALRNSLEEMRTEVQQLRVDKALLQEKLYQQEERMKHELKLIKLAALQQQQQQQHQQHKHKKSVGGSTATANNSSKASMASGTSQSFPSNQPSFVLPDHMLNNNKELSANGSLSKTLSATSTSQTTPKQATQSAFASPTAATPPPTNLSLASYQSGDSPQKKTPATAALPAMTEIRRQKSHDESVKSAHSGVSKSSRDSGKNSAKRTVKPAGSWIMGRSNKTPATSEETAPLSSSGPVDTDDWVPVQDNDDHEPEDIQQHPEILEEGEGNRAKDGYGTDDSDDNDSFDQMVVNARSNELPTEDFFATEEPAPATTAPIKILNVTPTATRDEVSFLTKATEAPPPAKAATKPSFSTSPQWKPPAPRGVSFPDTAGNDDDNASLGNTVASSTFGEDRQKVVDQVILDPYGDKGTYTGIILRSTGMPHGPGRMIYQEDRRTYDGEWRHGRWHGYGRATFANGDTYDGEYRFDQRHGRGRYQWSDGRVYDGMFREDRRHGRGTFTWPDGAVYEGEFRSGQREGQGSYQFSDGGRYEGSWKDGRYNGYGVCKWEDGRCYKGEWLNGMAHGKGIETFADGTVRHDGQWIEDEPCL